jgi:NAD(P)-dependent dehydrogenase (short-subunit alcohol dehydrogenase family)
MARPVCAVVGVGPGNGAALARRFAAAGHAVALLARGREFSAGLAAELGEARAYQCDIADASSVAATFARIRSDLGDVDVLAYNAGSGTWGTVEDIAPEAFETAWRVNTLGLLLAAQQVIAPMKQKGAGSIVVIGATASRRGMPRTAAFAPAKAAQLSLAQSMARHLWPAGIHVSVIILDGVVDIERTRQQMSDKTDDFFIKPADVAETAWWLTGQKRSAWSFEVEARPFGEKW